MKQEIDKQQFIFLIGGGGGFVTRGSSKLLIVA